MRTPPARAGMGTRIKPEYCIPDRARNANPMNLRYSPRTVDDDGHAEHDDASELPGSSQQ